MLRLPLRVPHDRNAVVDPDDRPVRPKVALLELVILAGGAGTLKHRHVVRDIVGMGDALGRERQDFIPRPPDDLAEAVVDHQELTGHIDLGDPDDGLPEDRREQVLAPAQGLLGVLAVGDVVDHENGAIDPAVAPDGRDRALDMNRRAIAPEEDVLMLAQGLPAGEDSSQRAVPDRERRAVGPLVMQLVVKDLADQFVRLPVEHPLRRRIDEGDPAACIHQEQAFRRIVGDRPHHPQLPPCVLLRFEPLGNIDAASGIAGELACRTEARLAAVEHPAPDAIVPAQPELDLERLPGAKRRLSRFQRHEVVRVSDALHPSPASLSGDRPVKSNQARLK